MIIPIPYNKLNFKEIVTVAILWLVLVSAIAFTLYKVERHFSKIRFKKAVQEMVTSGELTQAQADGFVWLMYEYKPRKRK